MNEALQSKPHRMPPTMHLTSEDLPAIKGWAVGQTHELTIKVKQTSASMGDEYGPMDGEGKNVMSARFEIVSVKDSAPRKYSKSVKEL